LLLPVSRLERVLEQLSAMLARETNYEQERRNIERLRNPPPTDPAGGD
jgi:hypothetical protein